MIEELELTHPAPLELPLVVGHLRRTLKFAPTIADAIAAVHEIRSHQLPAVDLDEARTLLLNAERRLGIAAKLPPLREAACVAPPSVKRTKAGPQTVDVQQPRRKQR